MSFKLKLGFGGLCLFVSEPAGADPEKMHVLMPSHGHRALLVFDENATGPCKPSGTPGELISLESCQIDFTKLKAGPGLDAPPTGVADLADICNPVPKKLLDENYTEKKIVSRVSFSAGKSHIHDCGAGAFWNYRGWDQQLAIRVVWEMDIDDTKLDITVTSLEDSTHIRTFTLQPYNNELDLWIFHLSPGEALRELPPRTTIDRPEAGTKAKHFCGYLDLLEGSERDIPTYAKDEFDLNRLPSCYRDEHGGLDAMCIAGKAPLAP